MNDIAHRLTKMIEKRGTSYGILAEVTGLPKSAIHRYATGETSNIPIDRLKLLANALNVDVEYLLGWDGEEESIYGDHKANLDYFDDKPELLEIYKEIHDSNTLQLLFDQAKDLTPEDLETVLMIIKGIKSERGI